MTSRINIDTLPKSQKIVLTVRFFRTGAGSEPVRDFLLDLARHDRRIIGTDIKEVQLGWPLGMPLVRKMAPDLWEIRSHLGSGIVRTLFTIVGNEMVLLHTFVKKSQRTPATDLDTASKRLAQLRRNAHG